MSLHARMAALSYLLTAWGRLVAGDYAHLRHMHIKLPKRPATAAAPTEMQECEDCCVYPRHHRLAA